MSRCQTSARTQTWICSCLARAISTPGFGCGSREKMAVGLTAMFLFFPFVMQAAAQQGPSSKVVGVVGGVAYLSPSLQNPASYNHIQWRRNDSVMIARWDKGATVLYPNSNYKGRLELILNSTLKISRLQKSDSSSYQVYRGDEGGKEHVETILLRVYDPVPKPTVKAKVTRDESLQCKATLECSVGLEGVTYEWIFPRKLPLKGAGASEQQVSFNPLEETYICKVSNPVSSNSASLIYRHPCSWTGESSAAASYTTTSTLLVLGHVLLLLALA
ncbi:CD48 antigen isoform X1 [Grus americana]|uniref:CD48 antigen isoform X1 n=1 Tax=Grus americana TaxID=9117 RepID=UPI00240823CF|nr:CD48 antigen isoform X1 [Grus americana]